MAEHAGIVLQGCLHAATVIVSGTAWAQAEAWPRKSLRVIRPFAAGGASRRASLRTANNSSQALRFALRLCKQALPIVRRMSALQHLLEHAVRVIRTFISAFRGLVVYPSVHNDPACLMVAEEKPVLLEELGVEPVLPIVPQGRALPILGACRVLQNQLEGECGDRSQPFGGVFPGIKFVSICENLWQKVFDFTLSPAPPDCAARRYRPE